mmetsp:Transcript_11463/g.14942  ORF Transcript_11463/g.14942 Transcript_11463/m.14942 type:complete len:218 (-) Transcript_11463:1027-1680(-)
MSVSPHNSIIAETSPHSQSSIVIHSSRKGVCMLFRYLAVYGQSTSSFNISTSSFNSNKSSYVATEHIFTACSSPVSFSTHFRTSPNVPVPNRAFILYNVLGFTRLLLGFSLTGIGGRGVSSNLNKSPNMPEPVLPSDSALSFLNATLFLCVASVLQLTVPLFLILSEALSDLTDSALPKVAFDPALPKVEFALTNLPSDLVLTYTIEVECVLDLSSL